MGILGRFILVFVIAFLATPRGVFGAVSDFYPRIYNNEGELEIGALYEEYKNTSAGRGTEATDSFLYERFILTTTGYIYHPRFIQFLGKVAIGYNQEKFTETGTSSPQDDSWSNLFRGEYELRALVLPEHPYNLELYTLRKAPYIRGLSAGSFNSVITSSGALFKYKEKPYNLLLSYDHTNIDSRTFTTGTDTYVASGSYTKDWGSFWGAYSHNDSDTVQTQGYSYSTSNTVDTYSLGNYLNFWKKKGRLTSTVTENVFGQSGPLSTVDDDRVTWTEQLNLDLPWRFEVSLAYRYSDDEQTTRPANQTSEITLWNRNQNANLGITQRLYQSLVTSYNYNYFDTTSSGGDSTASSHILSSTYRKMIPRGYLNAMVSLGRSVTEGEGAPNVINETPPPTPILGEFTLQGNNVDGASIVVSVRSAQTGNILPLVKDVHYIVTPYGLTFRIRILSVPAEAESLDPLYKYEFLVTYSYASFDYKLETTNVAFSLGMNLFERLINPYYFFSRSDQQVVSGTYPGGDQTVVVNTVGVSCEQPSYVLLAEYQDYDSTLNPMKTFRADGSYWQTFNETTSLTANAYYMDRIYLAVPELDTPEYTETTFGGRLRGETKFPNQHLTASLAANYWETQGMYRTKSSLLNAQLIWKVGQLDLTLGADVGSSETELLKGKQETNHNVYYLTMKRKLFGR